VAKLLGWQHSGFSVDNQVRIEAKDSEGREQLAQEFETHFSHWIGQAEHVEQACERGGQRWAHGIRACRLLFPS